MADNTNETAYDPRAVIGVRQPATGSENVRLVRARSGEFINLPNAVGGIEAQRRAGMMSAQDKANVDRTSRGRANTVLRGRGEAVDAEFGMLNLGTDVIGHLRSGNINSRFGELHQISSSGADVTLPAMGRGDLLCFAITIESDNSTIRNLYLPAAGRYSFCGTFTRHARTAAGYGSELLAPNYTLAVGDRRDGGCYIAQVRNSVLRGFIMVRRVA